MFDDGIAKAYRAAKKRVSTGSQRAARGCVSTDSEGAAPRPNLFETDADTLPTRPRAWRRGSLALGLVLRGLRAIGDDKKARPKGSKARLTATIQMDDGDTDAAQKH